MSMRIPAIVAILLLIASTACKKDKNETPALPEPLLKVKSMIITSMMDAIGAPAKTFTYNVSYDSLDRLSSILGQGIGTQEIYTYENDRYYREVRVDWVLQLRETFFLNSSRTLVDSSIQPYSGSDTTLSRFLYNGKMQLVQRIDYYTNGTRPPSISNTTTYVYDRNGLLTSEETNTTKRVYEYDMVVKDNLNTKRPFFYRQKQLPAKALLYNKSDGAILSNYVYTYVLDEQNRLKTEKAQLLPNGWQSGQMVIKTYNY